VVAVGCGGSVDRGEAREARQRPATACDALAAYAPWDGLPPGRAKPDAPSSSAAPERNPKAKPSSPSSASLAFAALLLAERNERAEGRLRAVGPVSGEGAEDVEILRAGLHVAASDLRGFLDVEGDAQRLAAAAAAGHRAYEDLRKACSTRRSVPPCRDVPDSKEGGWFDKVDAIAKRRETVRVRALRAPLDRFAEVMATSAPILEHWRAVMFRSGHAMIADEQRVDAAVDRLVARCGAPPPRPAEGDWIAAPVGTRPRDLVTVIKAEASPRLAARALNALRPVLPDVRALEAAQSTPITLGSFGTGFLVVRGAGRRERAYVLTNRHVVAHGVTFELEGDSGEKLPAAEVIYEDRAADVAVLALASVPARMRGGFVFANRPAHDGEAITVAGFPGLGQRPTYQIVKGAVSNERLELEGVEYLQHTAPTDPGASGSPLLDASGRVVGVAMGKAIGRDAASMAVPRHALLDALERALVVERVGDDESFRREELVKACLSIVGASLDGRPVTSTRFSRRLVEDVGPGVLASALAAAEDDDDADWLREQASSDPLGAIDVTLAVDVAAHVRAAGTSPVEMCSGAYHARELSGSGPVRVELSGLEPLSLAFVFERGAYKLAGY
jgi:S1-C subfamily serine protease